MSVFRWAAPILKIAGRRWEPADFDALARSLRPYVPPGGLLADLGGGTGDSGCRHRPGARSTGHHHRPYSPDAASRGCAIRWCPHVWLGPKTCRFPTATSMGLICSDAFHHIRDQDAAAHEITRVVRAGGGVMLLELEPSRMLMTFERMLGEPASFM